MKFELMVSSKIKRSRKSRGRPLSGFHEAYGLILEEIDEFWDEVRKKPRNRNVKRALLELSHISAAAQMAAEDLCGGRRD